MTKGIENPPKLSPVCVDKEPPSGGFFMAGAACAGLPKNAAAMRERCGRIEEQGQRTPIRRHRANG